MYLFLLYIRKKMRKMYNNLYFQPYNPNYRPIEQQFNQNNMNIPTMQQQPLNVVKSGLQGKLIDNIDTVKILEIPLDGSTSYFPLTDNSAKVTKALQSDGTSKITVYKPVDDKKSEVKYFTNDDLEKALKGLNLDEIDDIKEDIKDIKKQLKKKE